MVEPGLLASPISAEDFERRARARLDFDIPADLFTFAGRYGGDNSLDGHPIPTRLRAAAVLVPVVLHRTVATVLLTLRPEGMRDHSGQIAFPGGKIEPSDASPADAALREAEEEIGLAREQVAPIGYLEPYVTGTGFVIVPLVATVTPRFHLTLDPREVVEAFEVPLPFLMDQRNHEHHTREIDGHKRLFYAMSFENRFIWGITAGILRNLHQRLYC